LLLYRYKTRSQVSNNSKQGPNNENDIKTMQFTKKNKMFGMINSNTIFVFRIAQSCNLLKLGVSSIFEVYKLKYQATYSNEKLCIQNASLLQV